MSTAVAPGWLDRVVATGYVPDALVRVGIRRLLAERLRDENAGGPDAVAARRRTLVARMDASPIAVNAPEANAQHYEVPAAFFARVLGPRLKYSSGYWPDGVVDLAGAEEAMLGLYAERARLADGQEVLELGCGWGSLTLWLAERYPKSRILGVSNSRTQRAFVEDAAARRGLANVAIVTADMNAFEAGRRFDRVLSIEMFEHMRNWRALLRRAAGWMRDDGLLFLHVFSHATLAYTFEDAGAGDWMARHFFTGGMMPADTLIDDVADPLRVVERWRVPGTHYARTAEAWLANMDRNAAALAPLFAATYGVEARRFWSYWRVFLMACAELWGYADGSEWMVSHALLSR